MLLKRFMPPRQFEVSLLLSSAFQKIDEAPDNWWQTTIAYKAATETLHGLLTKWGVAFPVFSISNIRWRSWQMMRYNNRIKSCYWNTSRRFDKLRYCFSCRLHFQYSIKILIIDDIQQSFLKLLLKHLTAFQIIWGSLLLSSPFQIIHEGPDNWWYTTIIYKAVTETLHAVATIWGVALPVICISNYRGRSWQLMIYNNPIWSCWWNTSCPFDKLRCRFSCHLHFN